VAVTNPPGLSAIAYRVGTHRQFKESMLAALSSSQYPALTALRTRADDDLAVALLDAWATVGDVLTFYQERIANESYLRTATERLSLLYLARLIGYELRPGVAASTVLAFTLETATGSPARTLIDVGVKVQSVPGPGEKPQTFETVEAITARVEWNALTAQTTVPQTIVAGLTELYFQGTSTQLQPGDAILLVGQERIQTPTSQRWDFRLLQSVTANVDKMYTRVTWTKPLGDPPWTQPPATAVQVYALRQRAALFGHNAPDARVLTLPSGNNLVDKNGNWLNYVIPDGGPIDLDAAYPKVIENGWIVLANTAPQNPTELYRKELYRVVHVTYPSRSAFALSAKVTRIEIEPDIAFTLPHFGLQSTIVYAQNELLVLTADKPILDPSTGNPPAPPITGSSVVLSAAATANAGDLAVGQFLMASGKDSTRGAAIYELVQLAGIQMTAAGLTQLTFTAALQNSYLSDTFALNANLAAATHGETVHEVLGGGDASQPYQQFTLLQQPLTYVSARTPTGAASTLRIRVNALLPPSTIPQQAAQVPPVALPEDTNVLWREVPTLYGTGPRDHVYVSRTGDDGRTTVEFGDGQTGARLPTGQANVTATYRKGIGSPGLVKAGQLSLLLTRPLGVRDVINPADATGAEDRQTLDDSRRTAPLTVLTLDRTVSLRDYEDFVLPFAGIAKAQAMSAWVDGEQSVLLTVAGTKGATIAPTDDLYTHLLAALGQAGDPFVRIRMASYREALFRLAGNVKMDPDYDPGSVLTAVGDALEAQFSFDARDFSQPVVYSEVVAAIQAVPGIVAVSLTKLYRQDDPAAGLNMILTPAPASLAAAGTLLGAEVLTLDQTSLADLGVMQ
jgi:hypothetical protein